MQVCVSYSLIIVCQNLCGLDNMWFFFSPPVFLHVKGRASLSILTWSFKLGFNSVLLKKYIYMTWYSDSLFQTAKATCPSQRHLVAKNDLGKPGTRDLALGTRSALYDLMPWGCLQGIVFMLSYTLLARTMVSLSICAAHIFGSLLQGMCHEMGWSVGGI